MYYTLIIYNDQKISLSLKHHCKVKCSLKPGFHITTFDNERMHPYLVKAAIFEILVNAKLAALPISSGTPLD